MKRAKQNEDSDATLKSDELLPVLNECGTEDAEDQRLRLRAVAEAQASLLRNLCRYVAESWREQNTAPAANPGSGSAPSQDDQTDSDDGPFRVAESQQP